MADDIPTLDDLPPIEWGHWVTEGQAQCSRCQCLVPDQVRHRIGHENWHAAIESLTITTNLEYHGGTQLGNVVLGHAEHLECNQLLPAGTASRIMLGELVSDLVAALGLDPNGRYAHHQLIEIVRELKQLTGPAIGEIDRLRRVEAALVELGAPNASTRDDPGGPMIAWVQALATMASKNAPSEEQGARMQARMQVGYKRELDILRAELSNVAQMMTPGAPPKVDVVGWMRARIADLLDRVRQLDTLDADLHELTQLVPGYEPGDDVLSWLRRRLAELLELRAELAKRDAVLQPAKQATVATAEQAIDQFIATVERDHHPGRFDAHCFACSWTTDGTESVVEDAVHQHATEHHVRKPEPAQPCPSLCLHDGRLLTCRVTGGPHATHISNQPNQKTDHRLSWTDDQAVPVPWPKSQEPPTGIDILQDTYDNTYLCRETDGWVWWSTLDKRNEYDGDASTWANAAPDADGDLIVIRPDNG